MFSQNFSRRLLIATLVISFSSPAALLAQQQRPNRQNQQPDDPSARPRNERPELNKHYRDWLERDVAYIITNEERNAFKKLRTDEEREQFIEAFWRRRDPNPDTEENEYREEYYERIAYANEHYASGIPGWKTDRGRIYIIFGKPDEVESHPSGGSYERPYWEGGGSTTTYPFEIWFYRYLEGVGSGVEIEFVDPSGSGEYHIARSPNERDALLMVPNAGLTMAEQLGLANKADRIAGTGPWAAGGDAYTRAQDSPFERLELLSRLSHPPAVKYGDLLSLSNTPVVEDNPLNFDVRVDFFRQSDERVVTAITIQMENHNLVFQDSGNSGLQTATVNIFGKITSVSEQRIGTFEDPVTTQATPEELASARERKSAYQRAIALTPGTYKVDVVVRDINSGATGVRHIGFTVPRYNQQQLSTSTLVLAARLQGLQDQVAVGQFVIGQFKVIPNVAGVFKKGEPLGLYMQVYNAQIDQTTLKPSVDVEYIFTRNGREVGRIPENWQGMSDAGQRLTLAKLFDTAQLSPGEYEVSVHIRDRVSNQTLTPSAKFTIQ